MQSVFGDNVLFKEIKKIRGSNDVVCRKMVGNTNPDDIADHLKDMYHSIYNRTGSSQLLEKVDENVNVECLGDVDKVTPELIAKIMNRYKEVCCSVLCSFQGFPTVLGHS